MVPVDGLAETIARRGAPVQRGAARRRVSGG
jgi:hypothetical protein